MIRPGGTELNVKPRDSWAECEIAEGFASVPIYIAYTARFLTVWLTCFCVCVFRREIKTQLKKTNNNNQTLFNDRISRRNKIDQQPVGDVFIEMK